MNGKKPAFVMGTTFWTNPKHPSLPSHLHIVISDPAKSADEIAVVNVTTIRGEHDPSCVLVPGDHLAIRQKSYVGYARGWVVNLNALMTLFNAGQIHRAHELTPEVLARVQAGAMLSQATPKRIKGLLAEQELT